MMHTTPYLTSAAAFALAAELEHKLTIAGWSDDTRLYILKAEDGLERFDYMLFALPDDGNGLNDWIVIGEDDLQCEGGAELAEALLVRLDLSEKNPLTNPSTDVVGYETNRFTVADIKPFLPVLVNRRRYKFSLLVD